MNNNNAICFEDVTFAYDTDEPIFRGLSMTLPQEPTVLVGPNGSGKSTFLLLAGGRLLPNAGRITLGGRDTRKFDNSSDEGAEELNRVCSFVYQNMEFDSSEKIGSLLDTVWNSGRGSNGDRDDLRNRIIRILRLETQQHKALNELSKGTMQSLVLAFALFYGSQFLILDEPSFAMEYKDKQNALSLVKELSITEQFPVYLTVHDIDIARGFGKSAILFEQSGRIILGKTDEVLSKENLESAYNAPMETLYKREELWRAVLNRTRNSPNDLEGKATVKVVE